MKKITTIIITMMLMVAVAVPQTAEAATKSYPTAGKCMMKYAKQFLGSRYKLGGTYLKNPKKKGDKNRVSCVGFVAGVVKRYGNIKMRPGSVKRTALKYGYKVGSGKKAVKKAKPGDILVYNNGGHVAFYYGKKKGRHYLIDASRVTWAVSIRKIPRGKSLTVIRMEKALQKHSKKYKKHIAALKAKENKKVAAK